jgi:hypothetical protein
MPLLPATREKFTSLKSPGLLTLEEYYTLFPEQRRHEGYLSAVSTTPGDRSLWREGMLKWPEDDLPRNWAGPWEGNYVYFKVVDYANSELPSMVELWELTKDFEKYCHSNYPARLRTERGWRFTDEQLVEVLQSMTPKERMESEIKIARALAHEDSHPRNQISVENPGLLYLLGTDDTSYSCYFSDTPDREFPSESVRENIGFHFTSASNALELLEDPSWTKVKQCCIFTN